MRASDLVSIRKNIFDFLAEISLNLPVFKKEDEVFLSESLLLFIDFFPFTI